MSNSTVAANITNSSAIVNQTIPPAPPVFRRPDFANKFNFTGRGDDSGNGDDDRKNRHQVKYKNETIEIDNSNFRRNTPLAYNSTRRG